MELWDPHFHIWDVSPATRSGHDPEQLFAPDGNPVYGRDRYEADLATIEGFEHTGGAFVEAVSVCHVGTSGEEFLEACAAEATWVSRQLSGADKGYVLVASAPLEEPQVETLLASLAEDPLVRGVRQIINHEPSWPRNTLLGNLLASSRWRQGYARLQDYSMSFDLQLNPHQFREAARLVAQHPRIPVIVGHLGSPTLDDLTAKSSVYWEGLRALSDLESVTMKLSMLTYQDPEWSDNSLICETVLRVIELFGVDRCFFASNFPVEAHLGWDANRLYQGFLDIVSGHYDSNDIQKLFALNAKHAYRV